MNNNWVLCLRLNMSRYVSQKGVTILRRQNLKVKGGSRRHIGCRTNHIKTEFTAGSEVIQIQTRSIGESFVLCHIFPDMIDHVSLTSSIFFYLALLYFRGGPQKFMTTCITNRSPLGIPTIFFAWNCTLREYLLMIYFVQVQLLSSSKLPVKGRGLYGDCGEVKQGLVSRCEKPAWSPYIDSPG